MGIVTIKKQALMQNNTIMKPLNQNKMEKFYIVIVLAIVQFIVCGSLILIYRKSEEPKHQGIVFGCTFGFGMSFVYLIEALNL